jgi:hypothetical protein
MTNKTELLSINAILPNEIIYHILSGVRHVDLPLARAICTTWNDYVLDIAKIREPQLAKEAGITIFNSSFCYPTCFAVKTYAAIIRGNEANPDSSFKKSKARMLGLKKASLKLFQKKQCEIALQVTDALQCNTLRKWVLSELATELAIKGMIVSSYLAIQNIPRIRNDEPEMLELYFKILELLVNNNKNEWARKLVKCEFPPDMIGRNEAVSIVVQLLLKKKKIRVAHFLKACCS